MYLDTANLRLIQGDDQPTVLWDIWGKNLFSKKELQGWWALCKIAVLHQPSSAVIERFFSVLKGNTSRRQSSEHEDTLEGRSLALYNSQTDMFM